MKDFFTSSENRKVFEITERLKRISSPTLRLQAILQYSQIVDILSLGDTCREQLLAPVVEEQTD